MKVIFNCKLGCNKMHLEDIINGTESQSQVLEMNTKDVFLNKVFSLSDTNVLNAT